MPRLIACLTFVTSILMSGDANSSAISTPLTSVYESELKAAIYWRLNDDLK